MKKYIENLFSTRGTDTCGVGFRSVLLLLAVACALAVPRVATAATYQQMGADRVLLMNNDSRSPALGGIPTGQGYWDTNATTTATYWEHIPTDDNILPTTSALLQGREHILHAADGSPLWHLVDCRAGNIAVNAANLKSRVILPHHGKYAQISTSPESYFMSGTTRVTTPNNAANAAIIMRDNYKAAVYSPYYGEGIGTIYFDIANSYTNTEETVMIQIATNLTEEARMYNESNPSEAVQFEDVHRTIEFDKWDQYYDWQAIPVTYLDINKKSASSPITTDGTNFVLNIKDAGTNHFFRVRTQLNYYGPMRFRIKRVTDTIAEQGSDTKNLVLIDNILVSYPPMTIKFDRLGHPYDPELRGTSVLGCIGDFDKPFLTYADKSVNAAINYSWVTNYQGTNIQIIVRNLKFNYRWRYLDQKVNPWKTVNMTTNKYAAATAASAMINYLWKPGDKTIAAEQFTNLYTTAGIPLSDGVGDLEYFYTAGVDAPYYNPRDYVYDTGVFGKMIGSTAAWKEGIGTITNRLEVADDFHTPALGCDYFTRIREGESDYKWVELCTTVTTNGTDSVAKNYRMELVGDHTWRYHYYVPTNMVGETFSFHFRGEQITTNIWVSGYISATNTWKCDLVELPYIPYTSAAGLGYYNSIACKLDPAATHLMIEFNDELLSFSISHASYQDFNAWTDATVGYVGHTNWNGEGAIGVSDTKTKYTLTMLKEDGWENSSFDNEYWYEPFETTDYATYPYNVIFDEHATPNGWTASHGQFIQNQRGQEESMALQMEGRGQGWLGMDNFSSDMMPKGIDQVEFKARLAQEPRFDDFAWYMDGISYTNYVFSARIAMGTGTGGTLYNPPDVSPGAPSVSLVGYYRPAVGCYEFRITRCGQYQLCAAIYKWTQSAVGMKSTMLCSNVVAITSETQWAKPGPNQKQILSFGNYLVDRDGSSSRGSCAYLYIKRTGSQVALRGCLSKTWGTSLINNDTLETLVSCTDNSNALSKGTFGVGSTDCNARFYAMGKHNLNGADDYVRTPTYLNDTGSDWAYFSNRWKWDASRIDAAAANFHAVMPTNQTIKLEFKAQNDSNGWKPSGLELVVNSFSTNTYKFVPRVSPNYQVRLRTGGNSYDDVRTDVVVDEVRIRAWQAGNYPDLPYYNGQSFNWVYMQGVVEQYNAKTALRLQPCRGLPEKAMGLRSPFLSNGISMFSFDYANANQNTKLQLQVCTNLVSVGGVSESLTTYPPDNYNWVTVTNWNFSTMTSSDRASGTLTHYMSFRAPTMGLIRLVVDKDVLQHCIDEEGKSTRSIEYGQITITGAYCYDEPALDMRSWYAWNFHTVGWNTKDKRFAYLFDSPDGLSGSLNFSALDADNKTADAENIGLSDREDIAAYQGNNSFVQCPPMTNGIGSVSFRARTFTTNAATIAANHGSWVTLYGSYEPDDDQVVSPESWKRITDFYITNTTFQTFQWKTTDDNSQYHSIRLEVAGSRHGRTWNSSASGDAWEKPKATPMQRVLIDEVSVGEPIQPRIVFRNVRPFRSGVVDIPPTIVSNVTDLSEQPLFGESWGLQCTIEPQQMGDELDQDSIKVYAAFKRGVAPWGYENWSNEVGKVLLDRIGDSLTYRSTWNHPESIISPVDTPTSTYPDNVWQYYIWCEFQDKAGNKHRHGLDAVDWTVPSWYFGINDLNVQYRNQGFAGYTILDTISPKRAWINEVNICDTGMFDNSDGQNQFIEIAVPRGADLTAWSLNVLGSGMNRGVIATYGFQDAKIVPNPKSGKVYGVDWTNDYTVVALRSPEAKRAGKQANSDGAWDLLDSTTCNKLQLAGTASLYYYESYGIELVRPSGVIEHQVVIQGTNVYAGTLWEEFGSGTNMLAKALEMDGPQSQWFFAGSDTDPSTLGVFKSHGEDANCWTNILVSSPSELNKFDDGTRQEIDAGWFLQPKGTNVWIYANVYTPNIHQSIGNKTNSTEIFIIRKGDSTNIVYNADKWWALGKVTTNGVLVAAADGRADRADNHRWVLDLPNVTDTLTVDAYGKAGSDVAGMGLSEDDPYFPAIMHWLAGKSDSNGLYPVRYLPWTGEKPGDDPVYLGLKDMYWLDIDPTVKSNTSDDNAWVFKAGMGGTGAGSDPIQPVYVSEFGRVYTNSRVTVTMMISNTVTKAAHAPDHLLGLEPGSSTYDYDFGSPSWTSVTFKVTAALQRPGDEYEGLRDTYYPLRWFVFTPGSFDENFTAVIDLWEPYSDNSPGMFYGWGDFPGVPIYYKWRLDGDPAWYDTAEPLKARSTYSE